eukprot:5498934-Pyramimonas_sp.AAC.1
MNISGKEKWPLASQRGGEALGSSSASEVRSAIGSAWTNDEEDHQCHHDLDEDDNDDDDVYVDHDDDNDDYDDDDEGVDEADLES